jgi:hypothetical protein
MDSIFLICALNLYFGIGTFISIHAMNLYKFLKNQKLKPRRNTMPIILNTRVNNLG